MLFISSSQAENDSFCIISVIQLVSAAQTTLFEKLEILLEANITDFRTKGSMSRKRPMNSESVLSLTTYAEQENFIYSTH